MPFTLTMPKLSPTMEEGTIAKWHVKEGEFVEAGALILEVATDKATVEHHALDAGWLRKILIQDGDEAIVNQAIAIFTEEEKESIEGYKPEGISPQEEVKEESTTETPIPEKKQSSKPTGAGLSQPAFSPEEPLADLKFNRPREMISDRIHASPLAKKIAHEKGLDLTSVKGSGPRGRIVKEDLDLAAPDRQIKFSDRETPDEVAGSYEEQKLTPMRKVISQRLQEAKTFIPHFYLSHTIDAENLVSAKEQLQKMGIKVTFNDFVIRAVALALRDYPGVNAGFNTVNQTITQYKTIDISIAVTIDEGLITPIIRYADYKNLGELSQESKYLSKRARDGKLEEHEYKGGSFTVSNLGMFGVSDFFAIINPPQAAILSVGGIRSVPVVKDGQVVPGKEMRIALSCDHRVVDGVLGAQFLTQVKHYLENAAALLI